MGSTDEWLDYDYLITNSYELCVYFRAMLIKLINRMEAEKEPTREYYEHLLYTTFQTYSDKICFQSQWIQTSPNNANFQPESSTPSTPTTDLPTVFKTTTQIDDVDEVTTEEPMKLNKDGSQPEVISAVVYPNAYLQPTSFTMMSNSELYKTFLKGMDDSEPGIENPQTYEQVKTKLSKKVGLAGIIRLNKIIPEVLKSQKYGKKVRTFKNCIGSETLCLMGYYDAILNV